MVDPADIIVFDRARRAARNPRDNFLADWCATQMADRLKDIKRNFPLALHISRGSAQWPDKGEKIFTMNSTSADLFADEESLPFKSGSLDLILCNFNLHVVNDLPGALIQIRRTLKPDGLFLAAMPGGDTLRELRESLMAAETDLKGGASPRVFPFANKRQMGALLQRAGFALPVIDSEIVTVTYSDMFALMRDLRNMGEGNVIARRRKIYPGREFFPRAAAHYAAHFGESDGRIRATFEIIFLIGWAPHESQQKPLAPGSAKTRLADVLESNEVKC